MDSVNKFFNRCLPGTKLPRNDDITIITNTTKSVPNKNPTPGTLLLVTNILYFSKPNDKLYYR